MNVELRNRRLENEWDLLGLLAQANPENLQVVGRNRETDGDWFQVILHQTHAAGFRFPDLFPSVPIEAFLKQPVFHPNVHPETGFVCLWDRFSSSDTIAIAVRQLQRVIRWEVFNSNPDHVMQPEALAAAATIERPLPGVPIVMPPGFYTTRAPSRPRLS